MEFHQIRYFLTVADTGNFTRAAQRCNVSQPALTAAIKKLEGNLDGPLFHRDRNGARLTALGELILPKFRRMLDDIGSAAEIARNFKVAQQVPFRAGVLSTIGASRLISFLRRFEERAPLVELEIVPIHGRDIARHLEDGTFEVVISSSMPEPPGWLIEREIYKEAYQVVLPPNHPLETAAVIELDMLQGERYVDRLACEQRGQFALICRERGVELIPTHRSEHDQWVESLVNANMGIAFMPEFSLSNPGTVRRPLRDPELVRRVCLLRSADQPRTPAGRLFWESFAS